MGWTKTQLLLVILVLNLSVNCQEFDDNRERNSIANRARRVRVRVPSTTEAPQEETPPSGGRRTRVRLVSRQKQQNSDSGADRRTAQRVPIDGSNDDGNGKILMWNKKGLQLPFCFICIKIYVLLILVVERGSCVRYMLGFFFQLLALLF